MAEARRLIAKEKWLAGLVNADQIRLYRTSESVISKLHNPVAQNGTHQALSSRELLEGGSGHVRVLLLHDAPPLNAPLKVAGAGYALPSASARL